jgi:hypothetical protein
MVPDAFGGVRCVQTDLGWPDMGRANRLPFVAGNVSGESGRQMVRVGGE